MRHFALAVGTTILALATASEAPTVASPLGQQSRSQYVSLAADRELRNRNALLTARLELPRPADILVHSDGTFAPTTMDAAARMSIEVDGRPAGNDSTIDWRGSAVPVRHSFNVVGAVRLLAGPHIVRLVGNPLAGAFSVSAGANLSVFVDPARRVSTARLQAAVGPFDYTSLGLIGNALPHTQLLRVGVDARTPTVALASATTRVAGHDGDSMLGIYLNGRHPGPASSLWTVNDTCSCAEVEGPVFTHALLSRARAPSTVSLDATEFPWRPAPPFSQSDNPAIYSVQPAAALTVLNGGLRVVGKGTVLLNGFSDQLDTAWDFVCVGSSSSWPNCPPTGRNVLLAEGIFEVPRGHPGVVMLTAKARVQGDGDDPGGLVRLWLTVDGTRRGSTGVQELRAPFSVSQRTISASYLTAGKRALRPGRHIVRLYGRADGSFIHLTLSRDIPLLWFG